MVSINSDELHTPNYHCVFKETILRSVYTKSNITPVQCTLITGVPVSYILMLYQVYQISSNNTFNVVLVQYHDS